MRRRQEREAKAGGTTNPREWFEAVKSGAIRIGAKEVEQAKREFEQKQQGITT